tara:strand:- start:60 stop:293 length:234 start_codon:yes stop_codon:yes gene_type:complete
MANKYIHFINGKEVPYTEEEITKRKEEEAKAETEMADFIAKEEQKVKDAKSGNDKLLALGLTQAEATALTGYTPPEE